MAKKSKEVKQWITIKGNHIPVYEGQTVDEAAKGFMKHEGTGKKPTSRREKLAREKDSYKKLDTPHKVTVERRVANGEYDHQQAKNGQELSEELKKNGLSLDSADEHDIINSREFNDEKVTMYDKDGNEYTGTYNRYMDGGREIVNIKQTKKADKKAEEKQEEHNTSSKALDTYLKDNNLTMNDIYDKVKKDPEMKKMTNDMIANGMDFDAAAALAYKFSDRSKTNKTTTPKQDKTKEVTQAINTKAKRQERIEHLEQDIDDMYSKYSQQFSADPNQWLMYGTAGKDAYYKYKEAVEEYEPNARKRSKYFKDRRRF